MCLSTIEPQPHSPHLSCEFLFDFINISFTFTGVHFTFLKFHSILICSFGDAYCIYIYPLSQHDLAVCAVGLYGNSAVADCYRGANYRSAVVINTVHGPHCAVVRSTFSETRTRYQVRPHRGSH